ncbi:hypothetical protein [Comamonas terrigena]|uniref:hypothetical protein n=1 Tax=Comamonas terrigena TaxID=32013 RepID=UPI0028991B22|nr:hypothetical protein [Comamonas terrigena]
MTSNQSLVASATLLNFLCYGFIAAQTLGRGAQLRVAGKVAGYRVTLGGCRKS